MVREFARISRNSRKSHGGTIDIAAAPSGGRRVNVACRCSGRPDGVDYAATTAGIGSAVTDLIFSIAKREVTFFSGTALISFL